MVSWFFPKTQKGRLKGRLEGRPFLGVEKWSLHRSTQNLGAMPCTRPPFWVQDYGARPMFGRKHEVGSNMLGDVVSLWEWHVPSAPCCVGDKVSKYPSWVLSILTYFRKTPATRERGKQGATCASKLMHQWPRTPTQGVHPKMFTANVPTMQPKVFDQMKQKWMGSWWGCQQKRS